jgi:N-acyl-L-homoserine lactone synthetase
MFRFSGARQVDTRVGVTSAPVERLLRHLGLIVERLGPPQRIGEVMSLAFRMPVAENLRVVGHGLAEADVQRAA